MSQYLMESDREANRLERMSKLAAYQPSTEVAGLDFQPGQKVLDAGCGSGLVAKYIADHYPGVIVEGCDQSAVRIDQAKELRRSQKSQEDIRFFVSDLENIEAKDNTYDWITCRFVFEFLRDPLVVLKEFRRILKPGGTALVIQFDGFIFNYYHRNPDLKRMLDQLFASGAIDPYLGRKLSHMFYDADYTDIDWDVSVHGFKGNELLGEQQQMWERFGFSLPTLAKVFGSELEANRFRELYCSQMTQTGSVLFYNKFLVRGRKTRE